MPVQTSQASFPDSFPSFMSVYGGLPQRYKEEENVIHPLQVPAHIPVNTSSTRRLLPSPNPHRESISSMTSTSTESSPTTTISPFDSPSGGDISPSSSPESPSAMPLSYPKFTPPVRPLDVTPISMMSADSTRLLSSPNMARSNSSGKRARNLKNLSLRVPSPSQSRPPIATASVMESTSNTHLSAPPSPVQMAPKTGRRRPAGLTIQTPAFDKSFSEKNADLVPPTPLGRQSLRHAESSPSLASITSPSFAPRGGMQLPRPMSHHGLRPLSGTPSEDTITPMTSLQEDSCSFSSRILHGLREEDDHPDSRESTRKTSRGYPNGPVRIYDSGVYLYLEPTAEEAAKFDVVINVAKEVTNPFDNPKGKERNDTVMSTWRNASRASNRFSNGDPQTAISEISFKSAFEFQPSDSESVTPTPTTPTQTSMPTPEYLHVSWDHNSEILDDLLPLCELIDDRIEEGKKVLVHCQLGASRSASLVTAYGLYKNRHMDFNSMYEQVKARSEWVGPNMSLIYQLTDFRSRLLRGASSKPAPREWFVSTGRRCSEPQVTRAEREEAMQRAKSPFRGLAQAPSMGCLTLPSTSPVRPKTSDNGNKSPKRSLSLGHYHFAESSSQSNLHQAAREACHAVTSGFMVPPVPPIPQEHLKIDRSAAASPPVPPSSNPAQYANKTADPRSPPTGGELLIMRSIDEFL
ncbi:hypothetical protein N7533_006882 [Penicillium manginii]|uniref:uncharacterized protein n=1 Tax=Penicillium manginii TaxID=203109 RepID=UPI0025488D0C|nr:uncharacterized protein N7533_006882 [Penicillium manginii]KAJ5749854.1 hypothetical protein N7533_006882 [Penicillium manginii]